MIHSATPASVVSSIGLFMNTRTVIPTTQPLPPPAVLLSPLLLTETSSIMRPVDPGDFAPEMLKLRATQVTVVLREILEQKGYPHGGIND
jgi:hypothetical protein